MSRSLLRSVLELRTPVTRLPPTFLLPIQARRFNSTAPIIEPQTTAAQDAPVAATPSEPSIAKKAAAAAAQDAPVAATPSEPSIAKKAAAAAAPPPTKTPAAPIPEQVQAVLPFLAAQPNHYITFHIHGRPYLVTPGDSVRLPFKMPGVVPGDVLRLNRASVIGSRDYTLKGAPYVDERLYECRAVVTGTESEPMRFKEKTKRRNRKVKTVKSKHRYTTLAISELKINAIDEIEA